MTYDDINSVWSYTVLSAAIICGTLILRLLFALVGKRLSLVKTSLKYIANTVSFIYVYAVYFSFAIVVRSPTGKTREDSLDMLYSWVREKSLEWFFWGLLMLAVLTIFNTAYQIRIEKKKDNRQLIILAAINLFVILFGILMGSANAIIGLTEEINVMSF